MDWIIAEFLRYRHRSSKHPTRSSELKKRPKRPNCALFVARVEINLPFITADATGPKHIEKKLTRAKLEQLTDDLFERTVGPVKACLADAKLSERDIDELVLVGGITRMPKVIETARKLIGKEPNKGVNPDEVVAVGAAIQAGVLAGEVQGVVLLDVTPLSLGLETMGGVDADDRAKHHDTCAEIRGVLLRRKTTRPRWTSRSCKVSASLPTRTGRSARFAWRVSGPPHVEPRKSKSRSTPMRTAS